MFWGDILDVRKNEPYLMSCGWGDSMIDEFVELRGLEQLYYDMIDEPEFVHEVMRKMTQAKKQLMQDYKNSGLMISNNGSRIGSCSYSFTEELPAAASSWKDMWGYAQAQELAGVSPAMLEEFVLPYQAELMQEFGLVSYGCCEPMDEKIDVIARFIPNLRILSISPYSNIPTAAEKCRGKYVMAFKLHPSLPVNFDENRTRKYIRELLQMSDGCVRTITFAEIMSYDSAQVFPLLANIVQQEVNHYWESL